MKEEESVVVKMDVSNMTVDDADKETKGNRRPDSGRKPFGSDYDSEILEKLLEEWSEGNEQSKETLWEAVIAFQGYEFHTYSGLPFSYKLKKRRDGEYSRELFIDRRENSKSLAWSSVLLAFGNILKAGSVMDRCNPAVDHSKILVDRPKALGDIRGVTYIYGMFYRFGLIDVPDGVKEKMEGKKSHG